MKLKRFAFALCALLLAFGLPFFGCAKITDTKFRDDGVLNIIDDNNRNWYEVFVRSYYDSDEDGVGDLNGVTQKLDYIKDMGFNGIWLMPICQSNTYHGYDVADYKTVESDYGTNDDFKNLMNEAHKRGINVIVDMVFNHTSVSHSWFQKAKGALTSSNPDVAKYAEYYNFADSPNVGYAEVPGVPGKYYECRFDTAMPDLNLDSALVRAELTEIMRFWLKDMNADGFRLDACTSYYTGDVDKNVEFLSFVNTTAKSFKKNAYIVGEVWEGTDAQIRAYYESGIDSCFLFSVSAGAAYGSTLKNVFSSLEDAPGEYYANLLVEYQNKYDKGSQAPFLCNHDTARAANMFLGERQVKMGAGLLSLMNGNVFVYYGDEIGMVCKDSSSDPTKRIAMLWDDAAVYEGQVFVPPASGVDMSANAYKYPSVKAQSENETSILNYYKAAMRIRNRHPEIARGIVEKVQSQSPYLSAFKKTYNGKSVTVLVNLSESEDFTVSISSYGDVKLTDLLDAVGESSVKGDSLVMKPFSIAVLA
ncbi:alpha-amylase family glycosyl hydrolase [Pumilibacter muris]|jgi:glycosidase|uniref:alpha-amylase family glycosyl hydrolase n=1 Tax=Pumilibacter muris TaxID=2941510 RepID=UPI00203AE135|nr:alpha-amylase family glycosyl hydrolase [Pumilibacter muris]